MNMRRISITGALAIGLAVIMAGCDSGKSLESKIGTYVPDDADIVVTVSLDKMLKATGSTVDKDGVLDPGQAVNDLTGLMGEYERENFESLISNPYVEWTNAVIAAKVVGRNTDVLAVVSVSDEEGFIKHLANDTGGELTDVDGRKFVTWNDFSMTAYDGLGFFAMRHSEGCAPEVLQREIEKWKNRAKEKPLQQWKAERLTADRLLCAYVDFGFIPEDALERPELKRFAPLGKLFENSMFFDVNISDKRLTMKCEFVDKKGKGVNIAPGAEKIDASLLKYATADQPLAIAMTGVKDLPLPKDNSFIAKIQDNLKGTMIFAAGPSAESITGNMPANISAVSGTNFTLAMRFKSEKAAIEILDYTSAQKESDISEYVPGKRIVQRVCTGYAINPDADYWEDNYYVAQYMTLYVNRYGDAVVVSTSDKSGGCPVKASQLQGSMAAAVSLPAGSGLIKQLNQDFGLSAAVSVNGTGINAECEVSETDEDFIATLMGMIGSLSKK